MGVEFDHLQARLIAVWLGVVVLEGQGLLCDDGTLLPEPLGGLVADAFAELIKDDAGEFPCMQSCIERFEAVNLLEDRCRDSRRFLFGDHRDIIEEQTKHALLLEAPPELPHRFGVGMRFLRAVCGWPVFKEDQGPDEFIAPLDLIDKAQFQLRKITSRFHAGSPLYTGTSVVLEEGYCSEWYGRGLWSHGGYHDCNSRFCAG